MTIIVKPLEGPLGAEVSGFDGRHITAEIAKELHDAFIKHHVLVYHGPGLNDDELVEFGKCFGSIEAARKMSPLATRQEIMVISNVRMNGELVGSLPDGEMHYHFDRIHQQKPNKAGVLQGIDIPSHGGDTCFANMVMAYETLPDHLKKQIEGKSALNTFTYGTTIDKEKTLNADAPQAVHPLVRTIPETGKKALYACRLMTDKIIGMSDEESTKLLNQIFDHVENPKFVYEHKWKAKDIVIWDNRCPSHARTDFDASERRLMKRVTVGDDKTPMH